MFDEADKEYETSTGWVAKPEPKVSKVISDEEYEELNTKGVELIEKTINKTEGKKMTKNQYHLNLNLGEYTNLIIDLNDISDEGKIEIAERVALSEKIMSFVGLKKVKEYNKPVEAPKPTVDPFATAPQAPAQTAQAVNPGVACGICGSFTKYSEGTSKFGLYRNHVCQSPSCGARGFINKDKNTGADVITWKAKRAR